MPPPPSEAVGHDWPVFIPNTAAWLKTLLAFGPQTVTVSSASARGTETMAPIAKVIAIIKPTTVHLSAIRSARTTFAHGWGQITATSTGSIAEVAIRTCVPTPPLPGTVTALA